MKFKIITLILFFALASAALFPRQAGAQLFGGLITSSIFCPCSGNFMITIGPPLPGIFSWFPGTPQFANFQLPRPGVWTLGVYTPGGICAIPAGLGCATIPTQGTIGPLVGTSF